ncbi:hypothetical protein NQ318_002876 [Aromia moschata]|uniref:Uncharacterized protein n=1 Tax=Aromia moschata TaxID=1265417 RepID=A0AAV8Y9Y8_9CUCU|nr:hypothetical protein NQ318_002876 [Aromia moschata]
MMSQPEETTATTETADAGENLELGQNESSSDTTSKGEDFDTKVESDRGKRFDYLLKQTEIFSHFMNQAKTPTKPKSGRPKKEKRRMYPTIGIGKRNRKRMRNFLQKLTKNANLLYALIRLHFILRTVKCEIIKFAV